MSDARRDDTREAAGGLAKAPTAPAGGPDLDCDELPDLLVKLHLADDVFDQPELLQRIEAHIAICHPCRRKSDSLRATLAAMASPSQEEIGRAWGVLKAEAERERAARGGTRPI